MLYSKAVNERTSARYTATLRDEGGALVQAVQLTTLVLWLFDLDTGVIINNRGAAGGAGQNALNANDVAIYDTLQSGTDEDGNAITFNLLWTMKAADNPILDATNKTERHRAVLQGTWGTGKGFTHEFQVVVKNVSQVGA